MRWTSVLSADRVRTSRAKIVYHSWLRKSTRPLAVGVTIPPGGRDQSAPTDARHAPVVVRQASTGGQHVILSEAKNLYCRTEILRFTQNDILLLWSHQS